MFRFACIVALLLTLVVLGSGSIFGSAGSTEKDPSVKIFEFDVRSESKSERLHQKVLYRHPSGDLKMTPPAVVFEYHCTDAMSCNTSLTRTVVYYQSLLTAPSDPLKTSLICAGFVLTRPIRFGLPALSEFIITHPDGTYITLRNTAPVEEAFLATLESSFFTKIVEDGKETDTLLIAMILFFLVVGSGMVVVF